MTDARADSNFDRVPQELAELDMGLPPVFSSVPEETQDTTFQRIELDEGAMLLAAGDATIKISPTQAKILVALLANRDQERTAKQLGEDIKNFASGAWMVFDALRTLSGCAEPIYVEGYGRGVTYRLNPLLEYTLPQPEELEPGQCTQRQDTALDWLENSLPNPSVPADACYLPELTQLNDLTPAMKVESLIDFLLTSNLTDLVIRTAQEARCLQQAMQVLHGRYGRRTAVSPEHDDYTSVSLPAQIETIFFDGNNALRAFLNGYQSRVAKIPQQPRSDVMLVAIIASDILPPDKRRLAQCKGDTDLLPSTGESTKPAKAVCARCPIRQPCLEVALVTGEKFGVWGGTSERERRRMRNQGAGRKILALHLESPSNTNSQATEVS